MSQCQAAAGGALRVELYSRDGCHLCEEALTVLERVAEKKPFELVIIDVDTDAELARRYGQEVPVVVVAGRKHAKYRLDETRFLRRLAAPLGAAEETGR